MTVILHYPLIIIMRKSHEEISWDVRRVLEITEEDMYRYDWEEIIRGVVYHIRDVLDGSQHFFAEEAKEILDVNNIEITVSSEELREYLSQKVEYIGSRNPPRARRPIQDIKVDLEIRSS